MLSTPLRPTPPTRVALLRGDRRCRSRRPIGSGRTRSDATAAPSSADEPDRRTRSIGRHLHLTPLRRQTSHRPTALCRAIFERSGADLESGSESDGDGEAEELSGPHVGWVFDEDTATEAEVLMMAAIRQSRSNNVVAHNPARHPVVVTHAPQKRPPREEKPTPRSNGQGAASENPETSRASEGPKAARPGGMPIVFVTAEVAPWSKTGGLGDVCGALPAALAQRGHSVGHANPSSSSPGFCLLSPPTVGVVFFGAKSCTFFFWLSSPILLSLERAKRLASLAPLNVETLAGSHNTAAT